MKLLVIGSSVEDYLHGSDIHTVKPGGIYYTASALHYYKDKDDKIFLVTSISNEKKSLFSPVYEEIEKKYIKIINHIPQVHLHLHKDKERDECYGHITEGLSLNVDNYDEYDGILINMITGFDLTLDEVKSIRKNFSGQIYLDIHSLARGINEKKERHFREIPNKEEWLSSANIVQVNESELKTLSVEKSEINQANSILEKGPEILIVTKGNNGARVYSKNNSEIISNYHSSLKVNSVNSVGCGDVFGALFFYTYIKEKNILTALRKAIIASGCMASYSEPNDLKNLRIDILKHEN